MSPENQRIAIAEKCGWKFSKIKSEFRFVSISPNGDDVLHSNFGDLAHLPDYLNDLNAMHEAEKALSAPQAARYVCEIARAVGKTHTETSDFHVAYVCSSSALRAEAFLRTLSLWTE